MKKAIALLAVILPVLPCRAEKYSVTSPDFFLDSASGARALAMGGAQTAAAEGPAALYRNPALLALPERDTVQAGYSSLFEGAAVADAGYSHSFAAPFGLGVSVAHYGVSDAQERDAQNNLTGSFGERRTAVSVGGGYQYNDTLSAGVTGRFITQSMAGESASAPALDIGGLYSHGAFRLGVAFQNLVAGSLERAGGSDALPVTSRVGVSVKPVSWALLCADMVRRNGGNTDLVAGVEVVPLPALALRGGYDGYFVTFGAGVTVSDATFDYAAIKHEFMGFSHRVSLKYMFGPSRMLKLAKRLLR